MSQDLVTNVKDHALSGLFAGAVTGTGTAIATAPAFLGYAAAASLGAPGPVAVLAAGVVGVMSLGLTIAATFIGGATATGISAVAAEAFDVEPRAGSMVVGGLAGVVTALHISSSLVGGIGEEKVENSFLQDQQPQIVYALPEQDIG